MKYDSLENRLIANCRLDKKTGCWNWKGKTSKRRGGAKVGRINMRIDGKHVSLIAYRVSHEVFIGPIPAGHDVDHLCVNSLCINPAHIEAVTPEVNIERRDARQFLAIRKAPKKMTLNRLDSRLAMVN
jgi:hypothetical protein